MKNLGFAAFGLCLCVTGCAGGGHIDVPAAKCDSLAQATVQVAVQSHAGPHGAKQPVAVSNELYNTNIYDQARDDYVPHASDTYVNYLKGIHPAHLRWPAGFYSQKYTFQRTGAEGNYNMTPALLTAYMELCQRVGAQPMITVNVETGTPDNAADLVRYVNKEMGYNIIWWEIGNEPDVNGWTTQQNPNTYAAQYLATAQAMRAVDPSIKLAGGVLLTGEDILGEHQSRDWLTPIMQQTSNEKMDAVSWHYYPLYSGGTSGTSPSTPSIDHLLQEDAPDWPPAGLNFADALMPHLRQTIAQYAPGAKVWISEFAEDPGSANGAGLSDTNAGALWAADALGRYADYGVESMYKFIFKADAQYKYTLLDEVFSPRPEYYTYWLYAQQFGDRMVAASSDHMATVAVHAALRSSDGTLTVMLVNKSATAQAVHLTLPDFNPSSAQQYVLTGSGASSADMLLNGQKLTDGNIAQGAQAVAAVHAEPCTNNVVSIPAYSVQLLQFAP